MQPKPHSTNPIAAMPATGPRERLIYLGLARRLTGLDGAIGLILTLQIVLHLVAAWLAAGWWTAAALDGIVIVAFGIAALSLRDLRPLLVRLMGFGLLAGFGELFTDFAGEQIIPSLTYPPGEPLIWASPLYMPFSWMIVLTGLGYLAWRLTALFGRRWATPICAVVGALVIPYYEEMAYRAGWWRYAPVRTLWHTPAYVLLFEGLVVAALPLLLRRLERRSALGIFVRAALLSAWFPNAALLAWLLLGQS